MAHLRQAGATGGTVMYARGTASSSLLAILGFSDSHREVVVSVVEDKDAESVFHAAADMNEKGIVAMVGINGENRVENWEMIQVICEAGYADDCMAAARKAGASGGTIIKGRGTAEKDDVKFFGYPISSEKEILVIVEEREKAGKILDEIGKLPFLSKRGKAVVFSLPVSSFKSME